MIPVGKILANIRRNKGYQQSGLVHHLRQECSVGQVRDIEVGRTKYIKPVILFKWLEWLELSPTESEYLVQENVRCLLRDQLKEVKILQVKPNLLAAVADLCAMLTRGKNLDTNLVAAEMAKHILPHLLIRPPYIDTMINKQ
jgi:hypothetical protein